MNGDGMGSTEPTHLRADPYGRSLCGEQDPLPVVSTRHYRAHVEGYGLRICERCMMQIEGATIGTRIHQPTTEQTGMVRATTDKTKAAAEKPAKAAKPRTEKPKGLGLCLSGSGRQCKGTFAVGGDARYKSDLIVNVINGGPADADAERARLRSLGYPEEFIENEAAGVVPATRARAIIKARGWTAHLEKRQDVARKRKEAAQERSKTKAAKASASATAKAAKKAAKAASKTTEAPAEPEATEPAA